MAKDASGMCRNAPRLVGGELRNLISLQDSGFRRAPIVPSSACSDIEALQ